MAPRIRGMVTRATPGLTPLVETRTTEHDPPVSSPGRQEALVAPEPTGPWKARDATSDDTGQSSGHLGSAPGAARS